MQVLWHVRSLRNGEYTPIWARLTFFDDIWLLGSKHTRVISDIWPGQIVNMALFHLYSRHIGNIVTRTFYNCLLFPFLSCDTCCLCAERFDCIYTGGGLLVCQCSWHTYVSFYVLETPWKFANHTFCLQLFLSLLSCSSLFHSLIKHLFFLSAPREKITYQLCRSDSAIFRSSFTDPVQVIRSVPSSILIFHRAWSGPYLKSFGPSVSAFLCHTHRVSYVVSGFVI